MIVLGPNQYKVLTDICADITKGLTLASIAGQGFASKMTILERVTFSTYWLVSAGAFLYFALYFSQGIKS